ncbi:MAG TPA: SRPBCC domain-containing protein [Steroidobacteraceae bacterium]|nr:SRPBCC domain-containing protein [Steroidobacteraceae bacterium]
MIPQDAVVAKATLLIRKPANEIFECFVDPEKLSKFWLAQASGPLEVEQTVRWEFMVPGAHVDTRVVSLEKDQRIAIEWSDGTFVQWTFEPMEEGTRVAIENWGFKGLESEIVESALEATQGFTIVLCDLKTLLEHDTSMNLVRDKALLIQRALHQAPGGRES